MREDDRAGALMGGVTQAAAREGGLQGGAWCDVWQSVTHRGQEIGKGIEPRVRGGKKKKSRMSDEVATWTACGELDNKKVLE